MVSGLPCACMRISGQAKSAASGSERLSKVSADTSFQISAPARMAASATSGLRVSMEIMGPISKSRVASRSSMMTGTVRRTSSLTLISSAPGRVLSPPMSIISAPWSISSNACFTATSRLSYRPPSEKLSGVTLRMPIICGRLKTKLLSAYPDERRDL